MWISTGRLWRAADFPDRVELGVVNRHESAVLVANA